MRRSLTVAVFSVALAYGSLAAASEGAAGPALVPMDEIVVPIVDGARAYGRLRIKLVILAHNAAAIPTLQMDMPALRETALIAAAEFARIHASPFAPVDAQRLSRDISTAMTGHDRNHAIARILLVSVSAVRS